MYPGIEAVTGYVLPALGSGFASTDKYVVPMVLAKIAALMATDNFLDADLFNNNSPLIYNFYTIDFIRLL